MFKVNEQALPINVLEAHRLKNRVPHPPNSNKLIAHSHAQNSHHQVLANNPDASDEVEQAPDEEEESDEQEESVEPKSQRARRHIAKDPSAQTLLFYPPCWKCVLIKAKQLWQYHITTENAFPDRDWDLGEATEILKQTIDEYEAAGGILDDGALLELSDSNHYYLF